VLGFLCEGRPPTDDGTVEITRFGGLARLARDADDPAAK